MGVAAERQTVELRVRLSGDTATRLAVAAAVRGLTPSAVIEEALHPLLNFRLPDVPEPSPRPGVEKKKRPAPGAGGGGASAA